MKILVLNATGSPAPPSPPQRPCTPNSPYFGKGRMLSQGIIVGTLICFCTLTIITSPAQEGKTLLQWQKNTQILLTLGSEGPLTISDVQQMSPIPTAPPESQP